MSVEPVTAIDSFSLRCGVKPLQIVARLRIAIGEDCTSLCFLQNPGLGAVALFIQIGSDTRCPEVHVDGKRRWGRSPRQATLFLTDLTKGKSETAELSRYSSEQIF